MNDIFLKAEFLLFIVTVLCTVIIKPWKYLPKISFSSHVVLALIIAIGLSFRLLQPFEHYIFWDEEYAIQNAKLTASSYFSPKCWGSEKCTFDGINGIHKKDGYPIIQGAIFAAFGSSEIVAFLTNIFIGLLGILTIFYLARVLFSESAGLAAASVVAILPEHIRWSATTNHEITTTTLLTATLLIFMLAIDNKKTSLLILCVLFGNFLSITRPEMFLVLTGLLIFTIYLLARDRRFFLNKFEKITGFILILVSAVNIYTTINSLATWETIWSNESQGNFFSQSNLTNNILGIFNYQIETENILAPFIVVFMIVGVLALLKISRSKSFFICSILLVLFIFYNSFYSGGFQIGETVHSRFATIWLTISMVFFGIGATVFIPIQRRDTKIVLAFLVLLLLISSSYVLSKGQQLLPVSNQTWAQKERNAILPFEKSNPDCLYVSVAPVREQFFGYKAVSVDSFNNQESNCVFFYESVSCQYTFKEACKNLMSKHEWQKVDYEPIPVWQLKSTSTYTPSIPTEQRKITSIGMYMLHSLFALR